MIDGLVPVEELLERVQGGDPEAAALERAGGRTCQRGHPMTLENTYRGRCRRCRAEAKARYETTDKGRERQRRYRDTAKFLLVRVREEANRRGNR